MALKSRRASAGARPPVSLRFARVSRNPFSRSASLSSLTLYCRSSEGSFFIPRREAGTAVFSLLRLFFASSRPKSLQGTTWSLLSWSLLKRGHDDRHLRLELDLALYWDRPILAAPGQQLHEDQIEKELPRVGYQLDGARGRERIPEIEGGGEPPKDEHHVEHIRYHELTVSHTGECEQRKEEYHVLGSGLEAAVYEV